MKISDSLKEVRARTDLTNHEIASRLGVTDQTAGRAFLRDGIKAETLVRYINAMGYKVYAVPGSIHLNKIFDDVIEIEDERME